MRVLLVDHDSEGLESIARAIRGVLELDCVTSKGDALLLLRQNTYDVLIACERAVDGSGLDLLGRTTRTAVPLKRIFAAAPERLQLLGPRLAPFKVQRTINYPIDLEELWLAIAQVTGGPNDETDGTIERVVLDERGVNSNANAPRSGVPARSAPPLAAVPRPAMPQPLMAHAAGGRTAAARLPEPAPEPLRVAPMTAPVARASAPVRAAAMPRTAPQMRAPAPPMQAIPPMPLMPGPVGPGAIGNGFAAELPAWSPEAPLAEDDFASIAAQARMGVQQKVVSEAARRGKQRLMTAVGMAVAAAAVVFVIAKVYDPERRARDAAIAKEVTRMADAQKVTDGISRIEIEIENAIMQNDLNAARKSLATLVAESPDHPRREFLESSINRAAELAVLAARNNPPAPVAAPPASVRSVERPVAARAPASSRTASSRVTERASQRSSESRPVAANSQSSSTQRVYGAPINELPRKEMTLDAPISSSLGATAVVPSQRRPETSFGGRTLEASDTSTRTQPPTASAGSATVNLPPPAQPAQAVPAPVDVVPARITKRVMPNLPASAVSKKISGFVVVRFQIGADGRIGGFEIVEASPQGVFEEAAEEAVRKWQYEPRKENGVAVASIARARLLFGEQK